MLRYWSLIRDVIFVIFVEAHSIPAFGGRVALPDAHAWQKEEVDIPFLHWGFWIDFHQGGY
jgi:hypothetical protein